MKKGARRAAVVVLAAVFLGSGAMLVRSMLDYRAGEEAYAEAEELVELPRLPELPEAAPVEPEPPDTSGAPEASASPEPEPVPVYVDPYADALRNMDFTALREVNSEVLGWLLIPNTQVSYPLLQHGDNEYYLKRNWKGQRSAVGSIFMECRSSADLSDFHTVIYGHNMNNGSMLGTLKNYRSQSYWAKHPKIYITTDDGSRCYEIFAAYEVSTEGLTYQIGFSDTAEKQAFLDFCRGQSVIDTGVVPTTADSVLTLSTCTGRGHATRWVVQGVLKNSPPPAEEAAPPAETAPETVTPLPEEEPETAVAHPAPEGEAASPEAPDGPGPEEELPAEGDEGEAAPQ